LQDFLIAGSNREEIDEARAVLFHMPCVERNGTKI
jgi:hypothetical protein